MERLIRLVLESWQASIIIGPIYTIYDKVRLLRFFLELKIIKTKYLKRLGTKRHSKHYNSRANKNPNKWHNTAKKIIQHSSQFNNLNLYKIITFSFIYSDNYYTMFIWHNWHLFAHVCDTKTHVTMLSLTDKYDVTR